VGRERKRRGIAGRLVAGARSSSVGVHRLVERLDVIVS
jgi:hypothetical protein